MIENKGYRTGEGLEASHLSIKCQTMKRTFILLCLTLSFSLLSFGAGRKTTLFLIGDSTCATKDLKNQNPERGWGHVLQPFFDAEAVTVDNHAVNGRSSRSFRDEGRWDKVMEKIAEGDYVFIEFGHNDQKVGTPRFSTPEEYGENIRRYIREARAKGAVPVVLTPIVRRHFVDGVLTDTHTDYPAVARRIAAEEKVTMIDMEAVTRDWVASLGDEPSRDYFMWVAPGTSPLCPDGRTDDTHLNVRGARVVARMIVDRIGEQIPALKPYIRYWDFVVAKDGSGDFFTVGEAVAAVPDFCRDTTHILVCEGVYKEKISIPVSKRCVVMEGRGEAVIANDWYAKRIGATGAETGTSGSSTVYFGGDHWQLENLTFANTAGRVGQAVAVQCLADDIRFVRCRFLGDQDTLYLHGEGNLDGETVTRNGRYLFDECYIEGTTDFIFGSAMALFRNCEIRSKADSYVTAASTCKGQPCGMLFVGCRLTADEGVTACYLGRPWRDYAQTLFVDCYLGAHILPEGWHNWGKSRAEKLVVYGEHGSKGPGAAPGKRVKWSRQLSDKELARVYAVFERAGLKIQ